MQFESRSIVFRCCLLKVSVVVDGNSCILHNMIIQKKKEFIAAGICLFALLWLILS